MKTFKFAIVGLALMLAITGNAFAQSGGSRGSGSVIDFDIITNVVVDETESAQSGGGRGSGDFIDFDLINI
jgi:hypothetical protein